MTTSRRSTQQRRAAWVAFGVVALALCGSVAAESTVPSSTSTTTEVLAPVRGVLSLQVTSERSYSSGTSQTQIAPAKTVDASLAAEKPLADDVRRALCAFVR
jgi:hypothetical protein